MRSTISAVLIGSELRAQGGIHEVVKGLGDSFRVTAAVNDLQQGMQALQNGAPQVAILDVTEIEQGVKEVAFLVSRFPRTALFVTAEGKNPDWILRLIRAGAQEYLSKPVEPDDLADAIRKVSRLQAQLGAMESKKGAVIAVYNPQGGMGTTTVAVNIAAALAARGRETALLDLNLCSADVSTFLDITPRYTLGSVAVKMGELDASFLRSVIVGHACGIHVLNGPEDLRESARVVPELLHEVIGVSRSLYEYTVIDAGGPLNACNLASFEASDLVLFNTVLNLPALKNAKRYLAALADYAIGGDQLRLVVNRHSTRDEINIADAEKILSVKTYHSVPNAYPDVKASINKGVPLVAGFHKSPAAAALESLTEKLLAEPIGGRPHPIGDSHAISR